MDKEFEYDEAYWSSSQFRSDCSVEVSDYVIVKPYRKPRHGNNPLVGLAVPEPFLGDICIPAPGPIDDESKRRIRFFFSRCRANRMEDVIEERILHWMAEDDHRDPLIIIGEVGVGKSAFMRYFFLERINEQSKLKYGLPDRPLRWGIIDHLHREKQSDYDNCQAQLSKILDVNMPTGFTVEAVLEREIKAFQSQHNLAPGNPLCDSETGAFIRSMTKDTEIWNQCRMRYLDERFPDILIYVLLDNIDPCDPEEQMKTYALVRNILISHRCVRFIVCLRPDTAQMGRIRSRLWETSRTTVDIGPVDIAEMLRLRFARSLGGKDLYQYSLISHARRDGPARPVFLRYLRNCLGRVITMNMTLLP